MPIRQSFSDAIGHTPLIRLNTSATRPAARSSARPEFLNPGGSVKDRAARGILDDFEQKGLLKPRGTLVEARPAIPASASRISATRAATAA